MKRLLDILDEWPADKPITIGPVTLEAFKKAIGGYAIVTHSASGAYLYCGMDVIYSPSGPEILCLETEKELARRELSHA